VIGGWLVDQAAQERLLALAEGLVTRLCHDFAGLAGTLSGTLEMALEDAPHDTEAASLATEAAQALAARVRLFRAAWGGGDMEDAPLVALAEGLPGRRRLALDLAALDAAQGQELAEGGARLILCLLLAACAGAPAGGAISVAPHKGGGFGMTLTGRHAAWPASLTALGSDPILHLNSAEPRGLAGPIAALVAASCGWRLRVEGLQLTAARA
jgi:hypothetical protein